MKDASGVRAQSAFTSDSDLPPAILYNRRTAVDWATIVGSLYMLSFVLALFIWQASSDPSSLLNIWLLLFYVTGLGFFLLTSYYALRLRPFRVKGGIVTLPWPVRLVSGLRVRNVRIDAIANVAPMRDRDGNTGIRVTLSDGTVFGLADSDLPPGASAYLLRLGPTTWECPACGSGFPEGFGQFCPRDGSKLLPLR